MTCTCDQVLPTLCGAETLPRSVTRQTTRACRLFAQAIDAGPGPRRRRLRRGANALKRAIAAASQAQRRGLSAECAGALIERYREASDRAAFEASKI